MDGRSEMTDSMLVLKQVRDNGSPLRDIHTVNLGEREISRSQTKAWSDTDVGNSEVRVSMSFNFKLNLIISSRQISAFHSGELVRFG